MGEWTNFTLAQGGAVVGPSGSAPAVPPPPPAPPGGGIEGQPVQGQSGTPPTTQGGGSIFGNLQPLLFMVLIFVLMYFFLFRGQRKEEKNRKLMVSQMKKGDEVMTIGGLIGKVVEVREDRVVLKVDESANVKETYLKSAIQRVLSAEDKGDK